MHRINSIKRNKIVFNEETSDGQKTIHFTSVYPSDDKNLNNAWAPLFEAENPRGALVFVHGIGGKSFKQMQYYTRFFSQNGYTTVLPLLPYHLGRRPEGMDKKQNFMSGTREDVGARFMHSILDIRTCVDYLEKHGHTNIHIIGFSFGGMIAAMAKAVDTRIKKGAFIVTGGNFEFITWKSVATKYLRLNYEEEGSCDAKKCHELYLSFEETINNFKTVDQLAELPYCFRFDASLFGKLITPDSVIMFNSIFDPFIPRKSSDDLWKRMGKPKRYFLLSGHLSSHTLHKKFIAKKILEFFNA